MLVSPDMVALHVAGTHCPAPKQPWRAGPDPRLWLSTRDEIRRAAEHEQFVQDLSAREKGTRPVLLGGYEQGLVYIDVARAPGPLVVSGAEPWATKVRELLDMQLPPRALVHEEVPERLPDAYWPIRVLNANAVSMLGCALGAELRRRERLLSEHGAADFASHQAARRVNPSPPPLPGYLDPVPYGLESPPGGNGAGLCVALDVDALGHLYIVGAPGSGRTQALRTIAGSVAMRLADSDVHIYGIDAGGGALAEVAALPQTGGVAMLFDVARIDRLLTRLGTEVTWRQQLISGSLCADLTELRARATPRARPAHLLVLIDGWNALTSVLDEYDGGRLTDDLITLLREGPAAGVHLIATGDEGPLADRFGSLNDNRLTLRLTEPPAAFPPGRGRLSGGTSEMQIALLSEDPSARAQAEMLRRIGGYTTRRDAAIGQDALPFTVL